MAAFFKFIKRYFVLFYFNIKKHFRVSLLSNLSDFLPSLTFFKLFLFWFSVLAIYVSLLIAYIYLVLSIVMFFDSAVKTMLEHINNFLSFNTLNDNFGISTSQLQIKPTYIFFSILNTLGFFSAFSLVANLYIQLYTSFFLLIILRIALSFLLVILKTTNNFLSVAKGAPKWFIKPFNSLQKLKMPTFSMPGFLSKWIKK